MMKHSKSPSSSSSSSGSHKVSKDKLKYDRDRDRDRQRIEDVKKLLGGNKLDTTFQIPKRTKPPTSDQQSGSSSDLLKSKSASTSPKYSISPKTGVGNTIGTDQSDFKKKTPSSSPTHNPPILSPSAVKSGSGHLTMMSLTGSGIRNNVVSSPPNLAAFDKPGCDKEDQPKLISTATVQNSKS